MRSVHFLPGSFLHSVVVSWWPHGIPLQRIASYSHPSQALNLNIKQVVVSEERNHWKGWDMWREALGWPLLHVIPWDGLLHPSLRKIGHQTPFCGYFWRVDQASSFSEEEAFRERVSHSDDLASYWRQLDWRCVEILLNRSSWAELHTTLAWIKAWWGKKVATICAYMCGGLGTQAYLYVQQQVC